MSICSETKEALPGLLAEAEKGLSHLKGGSYVTSQGVTLYEATLAGQEGVLVFGHIPFGKMIQAVCAFLTAEDEEETIYDPGTLQQAHEIAKDLTYRRVSLPEKTTTFDMTKLDWFGGRTPVTVWVR